MTDAVDIRAVELGEYIVKNRATVRSAAKAFSVSKSTVHMDVTKRLKNIAPDLYADVRKVREIN